MKNQEGLSTEIRLGRVIIVVGILVGILEIIPLISVEGIPFVPRLLPVVFSPSIPISLPMIKTLGVMVACNSIFFDLNGYFTWAGLLIIIACVIPPLDLILLLGGLLTLASPEGRTTDTNGGVK